MEIQRSSDAGRNYREDDSGPKKAWWSSLFEAVHVLPKTSDEYRSWSQCQCRVRQLITIFTHIGVYFGKEKHRRLWKMFNKTKKIYTFHVEIIFLKWLDQVVDVVTGSCFAQKIIHTVLAETIQMEEVDFFVLGDNVFWQTAMISWRETVSNREQGEMRRFHLLVRIATHLRKEHDVDKFFLRTGTIRSTFNIFYFLK